MKKIGLLALALVLALGSLGVGFALWSETLYIDGTVYTGELSAEWSLDGYWDDEAKDWVSSVDAWISGDTLYVVVYNGYPCINYYVDFDITNTGTIPLWICDLDCDYGDFPGTCSVTNLGNRQVEPGGHEWGTIQIHMDNTAEESHTYVFTCSQMVVQYNEANQCPPGPD